MKIKWLKINSNFSLNYFINLINEFIFKENSTMGFIIEEINKIELTARYIEKITTKTYTIDPFGNEEIEDRINYINISFKIMSSSSNLNELLIYNPPRSIKPLFDFFSKEVKLNYSIDKINFDIEHFIHLNKKIFGNRSITIKKIVAENVFITKNSSAKMTLKSSKGTALSDLKNTLNLSDIDLSSAIIDIKSSKLNDTIEISKNGYLVGESQQYLEKMGRELIPTKF
ncbi:hypothetical protein ACU6U9_07400 [Pseudomonas sp. HK3]